MAIKWIESEDSLHAMVVEHVGHGEEIICYLSPGRENDYTQNAWIFHTEIELAEFPDIEEGYIVLSSSPHTLEEAKHWAESTMREGIKDQVEYYQKYMEALRQ